MHRKSDGIHVGSLTLRCGDKPTIIGIGIKDEFKRQGLGTDFVKQVCELTGNATLYVVETNIVGDNAKQFFQKLQDHEKRIKIITWTIYLQPYLSEYYISFIYRPRQ